MVTSASAIATMSAFPTGSRVIGPPNPYKYWWLRSPYTGTTVHAYYVRSDGDVDFNGYTVYNVSYGRISPDSFMYYNYTSFYLIEDGSMITYAVEYFYG